MVPRHFDGSLAEMLVGEPRGGDPEATRKAQGGRVSPHWFRADFREMGASALPLGVKTRLLRRKTNSLPRCQCG